MINSAAACVNPISTGELMRLSSQPKPHEAEYDLQRARQQGQPDGQLDPVGAAGLGQAMQ
jgi:hypothetical protein